MQIWHFTEVPYPHLPPPEESEAREVRPRLEEMTLRRTAA